MIHLKLRYTKERVSEDTVEIGFANIVGNPSSNAALKTALDEKAAVSALTSLSDSLSNYELTSAHTSDINALTSQINGISEDITTLSNNVKTDLANKLDTTAYTPTDLSDYYKKEQTSGATELSTAFAGKQDKGDYALKADIPTDFYKKSETSGSSEIAAALANKLDATAYTPTDLSNYYQKTETSGATELSTAFAGKQNVGDYALKSEIPTDFYKKSETSGATEITNALSAKLDTTAYTPTNLSNYYQKTETSGATELSTAFAGKQDTGDYALKVDIPTDFYSKTEVDAKLSNKLDSTAYTPTDLSNYYQKTETSGATELNTAFAGKQDTGDYALKSDIPTDFYKKSETSGATEISTALSAKLDSSAYTATDLTDYYKKEDTSGSTQIQTALDAKQNTLTSTVTLTFTDSGGTATNYTFYIQ